MKHLDLSVLTDFHYPMVALERKGHFQKFPSYLEMIFTFSSADEFIRAGKTLYEAYLHPTIAPFDVWIIDNFKSIVEELGYTIVRTKKPEGK